MPVLREEYLRKCIHRKATEKHFTEGAYKVPEKRSHLHLWSVILQHTVAIIIDYHALLCYYRLVVCLYLWPKCHFIQNIGMQRDIHI